MVRNPAPLRNETRHTKASGMLTEATWDTDRYLNSAPECVYCVLRFYKVS